MSCLKRKCRTVITAVGTSRVGFKKDYTFRPRVKPEYAQKDLAFPTLGLCPERMLPVPAAVLTILSQLVALRFSAAFSVHYVEIWVSSDSG